MEGSYILNRQGEEVKVTDLDEAIVQAQQGVTFNEGKIKRGEEITFPEALEDWKHILFELEKLKLRRNYNGQNNPF